jgi:hypothetical protein
MQFTVNLDDPVSIVHGVADGEDIGPHFGGVNAKTISLRPFTCCTLS